MTEFRTFCQIPASAQTVFAAFQDPARLARWWGPDGFTNTITLCEFRPGGKWSLVMHGPDGANYPNESVFAEVVEPSLVVVEHLSMPVFRLTIALTTVGGGTRVDWTQAFEDDAVAQAMKPIVLVANDQNLARLTAEVASRK